jgi:hypothetical protein
MQVAKFGASFMRLAGSISILLTAAAEGGEIRFNRDVRPILSDKCFACHGPDTAKRAADLRLDDRAAAVSKGAIKPGDAAESELVHRIDSDDPETLMPPSKSNKRLTPAEKDVLKRWIAAGAPYEKHWSFAELSREPPPDVGDAEWMKNPIDRFVLRRMETAGLRPAAPADRVALLRRASLDLTGLPPTPEEVDAMLADRSSAAFEKAVDRLLTSPRYGERMAVDWLDAARYSDSYGYQVDKDRFIWPWRDWTIRAFNANLPYDRFIAEQLAGDLLPNATDEQIIATTFNRLHGVKIEGGSTPEEFRVEYVADRATTFGSAFLGLTFECARCHDHKFDPISTKEFYQLSAFFANIDESGLGSYFTDSPPTPTLAIADAASKANLSEVERRIGGAVRRLERVRQERHKEFAGWLKSNGPKPLDVPGRIAHLDFETRGGGPNESVTGKVGKGVRLTGDDPVNLAVGNFDRNDPFSVALWLNTPDVKERAVVFHRSRAWTDAASRGYELLLEEGRPSFALVHFWPGDAMRIRTKAPIPINRWVHVAVTYDGSSRASGMRIYVDGKKADCEVIRDNLTRNVTGGGGDHIAIGERFRDRGFKGGLVDEFQVYKRELSPLEVAELQLPGTLANAKDDPRLAEYYLSAVDPAVANERETLRALRIERSKIVDPLPALPVMREFADAAPTHVLKRGQYDQPGERVEPMTPTALPPFPADAPRNRLGLAKWLTGPASALTARVAVNRLWQSMFGQGLMRTPEDFGSQGTPPANPELLDWLAADFVANGWDVKRTLKLIAMSRTYQQSPRASDESLAKDPENLWLSRSPSPRLSGETIRDAALLAGGLLVERIGGPPARPYDLESSFKPAQRDKGEGLYRRSLYTFWRRNGAPPVLTTFDAPSRDVCRLRRDQTATPLQAFVLLHGPQFVEAARALADRSLKQHPDDPDAAIRFIVRRVLNRPPTDAELGVLRKLLREEEASFATSPDRANKFLAVGDSRPTSGAKPAALAAAAIVARVVMNHHEAVHRP